MPHIKQTLPTTQGCTLTVDLEVEVTVTIHGVEVKKVSGTVTVTPGGKCTTSGTLTIASAAAKKRKPQDKGLTVALNSPTLSKLSKATWQGDTEITKLLNSPSVNREFCSALKALKHAES